MALIRPFYDKPWPGALRPAAQALWHWHLALRRPNMPVGTVEELQAFLEIEARRMQEGKAVRIVPEEIWQAAWKTAEQHQLPVALLAAQVRWAWVWRGPARFSEAAVLETFLHDFAGAHGRLLARLAGVGTRFHDPQIDALAAGFFLTDRLTRLPRDLAADRLFIPLDDLERAGVSVELLQRGADNPAVRRLLWKQVVRAREALARGRALVHELPRRYARALRHEWMLALEVLRTIERRNYDVWRGPVHLSRWQRLQVAYQARFSRVAFRT
ncbi:phytoene/squalene synthase family protein [Rhodothermus profundi]|uniref:Phytoene synthase n=1 Tax=Rhodothermus profundi TaxID=633813 RepID=A0A1M6SFL9_9BACT|nr:squalene/phytoene synthase family protein [Rhodothermus profundi]SHK43278.1 phytoene synthase [Rhodothermus profundi]